VLIKDDEAFALTLLAEEGVATVHGAAFCYPGYIRISYANATDELTEACTRIQRFCKVSTDAWIFPTNRPGPTGRQRPDDDQGARTACRRQAGDHPDDGEPNFDSPRHAIEAAHQAALRGDTKYPPQDGTRALKEAIQRKFKRDSGLDYAMDEISVSNGGKQCLFNAIMATVDPGDEVIIPVPSWIAYAQMTRLCEGVPVLVNCPQNNGFKPRAEDIDAAITPRTKWLILNNPNNPTGACCSAAEIAEIAAVMRKHPHVWCCRMTCMSIWCSMGSSTRRSRRSRRT